MKSAEKKEIDWAVLVPTTDLVAQTAEERRILLRETAASLRWLLRDNWIGSSRAKNAYFAFGVAGIINVQLVEWNKPTGSGKLNYTWLVGGDLPWCAFSVEENPDALAVMRWYSKLMGDWVKAVQKGRGLDTVYPVDAPATKQNARALKSRLERLRKEVFPIARDYLRTRRLGP